jgi:steroid delta-isomerase-like uncharacterized protein
VKKRVWIFLTVISYSTIPLIMVSENERIVRDFYKFLEKRDFDGIKKLLHDDFKWIGSSTREGDFQVLRNSGTKDVGAFPDLKIHIRRMLTQDDTVVVEYDWIGTHKEEIWGIKPTNKQVSVPFAEFFDIENGKIKFWRVYGNMILYHLQLTGKPYPFHTS